MGDIRFERALDHLREAADRAAALRVMRDEDVVAALAAASRERDAYFANILATEALHRVRRLRAANAHLGEGVIVMDARRVIIDANPAVERELGWRRADLVGRDVDSTICVHPDYEPCPLARIIDTGRTVRWNETLLRRRDGAHIHATLTGSPLLRAGATRDDARAEDVEGAVLIFRDITTRKEADDAVRAHASRLESQNAALVELTRSIGLRPPDVQNAFRAITRAAAKTLQVARVSLWRFHGEALECECVYEEGKGYPEEAYRFPSAEFPRYFRAIRDARFVSTADAARDQRTSEYAQNYLRPLGITSMIDAPIRVGDRLYGVVCFEHTAEPREWTADEEQFAGSVASVAALAIEFHARARAEIALRAQRLAQSPPVAARGAEAEHFRLFVELGLDLFLLSDADGNIVYISPSARELLGQEPARLVGSSGIELVHPDDREEALRALQEIQQGGGPLRVTVRFLRKEGGWFHAEVVAQGYRDGSGQFAGVVAVTRDVSERMQMERMLRERAEEVEDLYENAACGYHSVDEEGVVVRMNQTLLRWLGYERDEVVGRKRFVDLLTPQSAETFDQIFPRVRSGERVDDIVCHVVRKDGGIMAGLFSAVPERDEKGDFRRTRSSMSDVTERIRAEAEVRALNDELRHRVTELRTANRELEAFSYSASHDLRAPLRAIEAYASVLAEDERERLSPEGRDALDRLGRETKRMTRLVNDLLQLSRIATTDLQWRDVDITTLAREELAVLAESEPARRVDVHVQDGLVTRADPDLLRIALGNLLGNAWKYTSRRTDARIEVGSTIEDGTTWFYVRDNGVGFDMARARRLFEPFQRLHDRGEFEGTGVGLATVRRILERHDGRVRAQAAPGEGATFSFSLPHRG